jgi:hypothetical protein
VCGSKIHRAREKGKSGERKFWYDTGGASPVFVCPEGLRNGKWSNPIAREKELEGRERKE